MKIDVDMSVWDAKENAQRASVILRKAIEDVAMVVRYGKEDPTQEDLLICSHACRVDLSDALVMLEAVGDMIDTAFASAKTACNELDTIAAASGAKEPASAFSRRE